MKLNGKKRLSPEVAKGSVRLLHSNWQRRGADIVINYHSHPEAAEETAIAIKKMGRRSVTIQANIGSAAGVQGLIQKSVEALGGLDILVNNAGEENHASFWEITESES